MKKILHRGSLLHESKKKTEYKKKKTNQGTGVTVIVKLNNKKKQYSPRVRVRVTSDRKKFNNNY